MRLWTEQTRGFSLTEGRRDPTRTSYGSMVTGHYPELHRRLGTDQFIWCHGEAVAPEYQELSVKGGRVCWTLEVPSSEIVAFVDGVTWHRLIGFGPPGPGHLSRQFREQAKREFGNDRFAVDARYWELEHEFWRQPPPAGSTWWDHLIVASPESTGSVQTLVPFPLRPEWIVDRYPPKAIP